MRPRTPIETFLAAVPPALLVGFAISLLGGIALDVYAVHLDGLEDSDRVRAGWARSNLASTALWVTSTVVIAVGLAEAARRATDLDRTLLVVASVLMGLVAVRAGVSIVTSYVTRPSQDTLMSVYAWGWRVSFVGWTGAAVCVAITLRRDPTLALALGGALVVAALIAHPPRMMHEWFRFDWGSRHAVRNNAILSGLYEAGYASAFLAAIAVRFRGRPPLPGNTARVAGGIARTGSALVARVVIALGFAFAMVMAIGARSPGLAKAAFVIFPGAALLASAALVSGLFQAAGEGGAPEPPRYRFTIAAALTLAALVATVIQAIATYRGMTHRLGAHDFDHRTLEAIAGAFPYLIPAVALTGLMCLVSALGSLRAQRGPVLGSADPAVAGALLFAFTVIGVFLQRWMMGHLRDAASYLFLFVAVAVANIVAQLAVARLCHKVAEGLVLDAPAALPTARVHVPE